MGKRVAILGGGVAGMSAAHELVERGFEVVVYELRNIPGGKARSMPFPGSGAGGRADLPGEHGFRFFPGFYRHLPDTMKRIPYREKRVYDNLVATTESLLARAGHSDLVLPARFPVTPRDLATGLKFVFTADLGIPDQELCYYLERLLVLLTSCQERRFDEYEYISWWDFVGAAERSEAYQKYCADGITRSCVALRAEKMSARTGGYILLQLLLGLATPGVQVDRVLNGPTNDVWFQPWLEHLRQCGVHYRTEAKVEEIHFDAGLVRGVTVCDKGAAHGSRFRAEADYYISALPVEVVTPLISDAMKAADPRLGQLDELQTAWMNGIQFYLDCDAPVVRGHTLYIDSPWALTSVSQKQFWPEVNLANYGDGQVRGVLSVDISDWQTPGIGGKTAMACTPAEIKEEVWKELEAHLNDGPEPELEAKPLHWFLDADIVYPNPREAINLEPLLINTSGSWALRPPAVTGIPNFFLAADYVRTHTDLATMEGANEAARRAVNGILEASGSTAKRCKIWPLREPLLFAPLRAYDRRRFRRGLRHDPRLIRWTMKCFLPIWRLLDLWRKAILFGLQRLGLC